MPIGSLFKKGYIFIWTTKAKLPTALDLINHWGYRYVNLLTWVKTDATVKMISGAVGRYFEHACEHLVVGIKKMPLDMGAVQTHGILPDAILKPRAGLQSEKPEEIHELIERFIKEVEYVEVFARDANLRDDWHAIGNQISPDLC